MNPILTRARINIYTRKTTFMSEMDRNGHLSNKTDTNGHLSFKVDTNGHLSSKMDTNGHLSGKMDTKWTQMLKHA